MIFDKHHWKVVIRWKSSFVKISYLNWNVFNYPLNLFRLKKSLWNFANMIWLRSPIRLFEQKKMWWSTVSLVERFSIFGFWKVFLHLLRHYHSPHRDLKKIPYDAFQSKNNQNILNHFANDKRIYWMFCFHFKIRYKNQG